MARPHVYWTKSDVMRANPLEVVVDVRGRVGMIRELYQHLHSSTKLLRDIGYLPARTVATQGQVEHAKRIVTAANERWQVYKSPDPTSWAYPWVTKTPYGDHEMFSTWRKAMDYVNKKLGENSVHLSNPLSSG